MKVDENQGMRRFLRNVLETYAKSKGWRLSDSSEKVIDLVIKNGGNCPCRAVPFPCPCQFHCEEVAKNKKCHCNLFVEDLS
jgi:ferredoxin-thioredoxin reductase catalytic subunit